MTFNEVVIVNAENTKNARLAFIVSQILILLSTQPILQQIVVSINVAAWANVNLTNWTSHNCTIQLEFEEYYIQRNH